ncbi:MAG: hypothetical protein M3066_13655 [Actinomycetota bacterium]|nr:hypothetical protein [Actinomycetota bacterium]
MTAVHRPTRRPGRLGLVVAMAVVVSVVATGCRSSTATVTGRLAVTSGQAEVGRPGEDHTEVTGSRDLRVGDGVRMRDGTAVIRIAGSRELELRTGTDLELRATPAADRSRPTLVGGDLLVRAPEQPLTVSSGNETIVVSGAVRISRGLALVVAVYEGTATVDSAGKSIVVPALRQVAVPAAGLFPTRPAPVEISPDDAWDQRYLSGAIALSAELQARSTGFSGQLTGSDGRSVGYFRDLLPGLASEAAFQAPLLSPTRPPGETLVGAAIALKSTHGSFADRWSAIFGFHDDGAPWGLVAMDQGVSRVDVLSVIDGAVHRVPTSFALAPPGTAPTSLSPPTTRASAPTTVVTATTVAPTRPTTPTTRAAATTTTTVAPTGPLNTGAPVIDNTVNALVQTLTGLLNSLGQK